MRPRARRLLLQAFASECLDRMNWAHCATMQKHVQALLLPLGDTAASEAESGKEDRERNWEEMRMSVQATTVASAG